ncbi:MAG: hypothetical protein JO251_15160 [Verrucomicrobia bacterium]|nr:hypothetical protein [Verrucomicrobiota bacterium]
MGYQNVFSLNQLNKSQRLNLSRLAEACRRLKFDQTLTARVVFDNGFEEPVEYLVQIVRFHLTQDLALVGVAADLKLYQRFVSPSWIKDRYKVVRKIEAILADLNRREKHGKGTPTPSDEVT